ncbi:hypothetical protein AB0G67_40415 [Streptomyces sp. NPDC021056]|uniref:hypothetical protein n=1 Tax=Streptomyces sp. NPDC021056 TaxID=3155012 RepID=UPI0033FA81DE
MRIRTTAVTVTVLLALAGCSSSDDGKPEPTTSSASASPSVDQAAAREACKQGWVQGLEDGSVDKGQIPAACDGVPNSAQIGMEALQERNAANRERMDDCLADPACTEIPIASSAP